MFPERTFSTDQEAMNLLGLLQLFRGGKAHYRDFIRAEIYFVWKVRTKA